MATRFKYTCPDCGKEAVVGPHSCKAGVQAKRKRKARQYDADADLREEYDGEEHPQSRSPGHFYLASPVIASGLIIALSYQYIGAVSLLSILLVPIAFTLKRIAGSEPFAAYHNYRDLLRMCRADRSLADRLVDSELSRNPRLDRRQAILSALEKLKYDRTR